MISTILLTTLLATSHAGEDCVPPFDPECSRLCPQMRQTVDVNPWEHPVRMRRLAIGHRRSTGSPRIVANAENRTVVQEKASAERSKPDGGKEDASSETVRPTKPTAAVDNIMSALGLRKSYSSAAFSIDVNRIEGRTLVNPRIVIKGRGDARGITITADKAELRSDDEGSLKIVSPTFEITIPDVKE